MAGTKEISLILARVDRDICRGARAMSRGLEESGLAWATTHFSISPPPSSCNRHACFQGFPWLGRPSYLCLEKWPPRRACGCLLEPRSPSVLEASPGSSRPTRHLLGPSSTIVALVSFLGVGLALMYVEQGFQACANSLRCMTGGPDDSFSFGLQRFSSFHPPSSLFYQRVACILDGCNEPGSGVTASRMARSGRGAPI